MNTRWDVDHRTASLRIVKQGSLSGTPDIFLNTGRAEGTFSIILFSPSTHDR
jgi:hypothetical protein